MEEVFGRGKSSGLRGVMSKKRRRFVVMGGVRKTGLRVGDKLVGGLDLQLMEKRWDKLAR